jgi:UTP--glucose-1-phosphate uridylyltransferase
MEKLLAEYYDLMRAEGLHEQVCETFGYYLRQVIEGETGQMSKRDIAPPESENLVNYHDLKSSSTENLNKLVIIKLNGGLGTTMGLSKAKSLLPVKQGFNFLDIIARQTVKLRSGTGQQIPLIFMNSFNTNEDTLNYLEQYPDLSLFEVPLSFTQNKYPRIRRDNLQPYINDHDSDKNWNPPGHGDIYPAMVISGVLEKLLASGIEYAFVANSDNLGAIVDERILNYMIEYNIPFLMEVCDRGETDKKGGHLAQQKDGQLVLREIAQCPEEELPEFQNISLYKYFNTNNLWIDLKEMKKLMDANNNLFLLPLILNAKEVEGTKVFQIETAMGAAISKFPDSKALIVPRERFAPVKKTSDLLTVSSDAYTLTEDYKIVLSEDCDRIPVVNLDERYYKTIDQLTERFPAGPISLKNCRSLTVEGDVTFGKDVHLSGDVIIRAETPKKLENIEIIS